MIGRPVIDMIGQVFGRLTVVERVPNPKRNDQAKWKCICECGNEAIVHGHRLRSGSTKSCGCFRRDRAGNLYKKHGKSKTPAYTMFYDARKRAQKLGLPFDLDPDKIKVPEMCPALGIRLSCNGPRDTRPSLDRVEPLKGYTAANTNVISFRANRIKSDATADELEAVAKYIRSAA